MFHFYFVINLRNITLFDEIQEGGHGFCDLTQLTHTYTQLTINTMVSIKYQNECTIEEDDLSLTLLEIALKHGLPHIYACGGKARCSTCRVMVLESPENLCPRNQAETQLAERKGLPDNIRLACQTRINGSITLRRLVIDDQDTAQAMSDCHQNRGYQTQLAVLFSDIRQFTPFVEQHLPYDVTHILNRYFYQMTEAIHLYHGKIDKYMGDGIMALFGLEEDDPQTTCLQAVSAGLEMLRELDHFNQYLQANFNLQFNMGIGIDFAEVLVGKMGHPENRQLTAIGDAVNVASRIESKTKEFKAKLLISQHVFQLIHPHLEIGQIFQTSLKGKMGQHQLYQVLAIKPLAETRYQRLWRALHQVITLQTTPLFLKLAFHDAATYDPQQQQGGANGSIRLAAELQRPENQGFTSVIETLAAVKYQFANEVSWADLIALAGAVSVAKTGGPHIDIPLGRQDADTPAPAGKLPAPTMSAEQLIARFHEMGFSLAEMVVLSGAHTLGKVNGIPFTKDLFSFTNSYFKILLLEGETANHLLASDKLLIRHPECRRWVERYALDQDKFFRDFAAAYRKMTLLNC